MADELDPTPYDALLLLSFGGPEGPDDVVPFLENVTAGRGIPRERLKEVGQHYFLFGGVSPINAQNREFLAALRADFAAHGLGLPVYWGNRNWAPYLTDTLRAMADDGHRRILTLATSAYASYSGCRQYRENLADALAALEAEGRPRLEIDKLRHYFNHPGFVRPMVDAVLAALDELPADVRDRAHLAFTTHSIPLTAADTSGPVERHGDGGAYVAEHLDVATVVADAVREATGVDRPWRLVYQSRSGAPHIPWLEPDICDHLQDEHAAGAPAVVMVPIGFVSDHMEVKYDLDTEATAKAAELGLPVARAATVGADPRFVAGIRELVLERATAERGAPVERCALGALGPSHDVCPVGCCPARTPRPAAAGRD
ncbi:MULTISPECIES: ferrochelatase [Streptomycetaceae]|uniref:Coproporphyrin III ferrochelatase n=1 Tax=Streptantibioticus cattleyicolor (strain ATCC 35852 / DSM 46488 / JCM 4925 / NBRC 14057 / NRRL 8057) TaxID=1003195 RepID=F8JVT0_STREN|nr:MULTISPECIES: ferrochelatase [Streptomycetaceae]AEW96992.1 ferrochelatase [Streptantibioticus cattleyicolor NRRL 8057 = DSM 46488]MYS61459.1 ferrochelatase [Streptomyces sp. SID5468]CCB77317.1 putative ferrochelatase [Streptantibioticus cattleyicolor NRRL 8057 = DSM 46488]